MITRNEKSLERKSLIWATIARFAVVALFFDAMIPLLPQMSASNGFSDDGFQVLLGGSFILFATFQLVSVPFIRVFGLYKICSLSCVCIAFSVLLLCFNSNKYVFIVIFASIFAVNSVGSNATRVALRNATTSKGYKEIVTLVAGIVELKQIAMPSITGFISSVLGWRSALIIAIFPVLLAGIWIELCSGKAQKSSHIGSSQVLDNWIVVVSDRSFLFFTLTAAAFQISFNCLSSRLPFVLSSDLSLKPAMLGIILSISSGVVALGIFISGYVVSYCSAIRLITIGAIIISMGLMMIILGSCVESGGLGSTFLVLGIMAVQSAFGFIIIPCSTEAINLPELYRTHASALFGFVQPIFSGISVACSGMLQSSQVSIAILTTSISLAAIVCLLSARRIFL